MGTTGYHHANAITYRPNEIILEVGSGESTTHLASIGPLVVTIDIDVAAYRRAATLPNVEAHLGWAEAVLLHWSRPIGFTWLDGHDWAYRGNPANYYDEQRAAYEDRGQDYSPEASQRSHLAVARLIAQHARVIAFDDTWRTHAYRSQNGEDCDESVPPATVPAPALALDRAITRSTCGLARSHPHHDDPKRGWSGKGGAAVPYLLDHGFRAVKSELCLVILEKIEGR